MEDKPTKSKRETMIIRILLAIIIVMTLFIGVLVTKPDIKETITSFRQKEEKEYVVSLEEFLVNIKREDTRRSYMKVTLELMTTNNKNVEIIEENTSKIRDVIINTLTSQSYYQVINDEGSNELKSSLMEKINESMNKELVQRVYITDLVAQ